MIWLGGCFGLAVLLRFVDSCNISFCVGCFGWLVFWVEPGFFVLVWVGFGHLPDLLWFWVCVIQASWGVCCGVGCFVLVFDVGLQVCWIVGLVRFLACAGGLVFAVLMRLRWG